MARGLSTQGTVVGVDLGYAHTCARLSTDAVRCWGAGYYGLLGYGNTDNIGDGELPYTAGDVAVLSSTELSNGTTVVGVALGSYHTCARLSTKAVRCWGSGSDGQLGYGNMDTIGDDELPYTAGDVAVLSSTELSNGVTVVGVALGHYHACVRLSTGAVRCWGMGSSGQLGYGNTDTIGDNELPYTAGDVPVLSSTELSNGVTVVGVALGAYHTCADLSTDAVRCWGYGSYGQLGNGNTTDIGDDELPYTAGDVPVLSSTELSNGVTAVGVALAYFHACVRLSTGAVRCWGEGSFGQLGYGNTDTIGDDELPYTAGDVPVLSSAELSNGVTVVGVALGAYHTCAHLSTDAVRCWGDGGNGRLGYGNTTKIGDDELPYTAGDVAVLSSTELSNGVTVVGVALGYSHTCAHLSTDAVRCWGYGSYGRLGYGNTATIGDDELPYTAGDVQVVIAPSPSPTASPSPTVSPTASSTASPTVSTTPTATPSATASVTASVTASPTVTATASATASASQAAGATTSVTSTQTPSSSTAALDDLDGSGAPDQTAVVALAAGVAVIVVIAIVVVCLYAKETKHRVGVMPPDAPQGSADPGGVEEATLVGIAAPAS